MPPGLRLRHEHAVEADVQDADPVREVADVDRHPARRTPGRAPRRASSRRARPAGSTTRGGVPASLRFGSGGHGDPARPRPAGIDVVARARGLRGARPPRGRSPARSAARRRGPSRRPIRSQDRRVWSPVSIRAEVAVTPGGSPSTVDVDRGVEPVEPRRCRPSPAPSRLGGRSGSRSPGESGSRAGGAGRPGDSRTRRPPARGRPRRGRRTCRRRAGRRSGGRPSTKPGPPSSLR